MNFDKYEKFGGYHWIEYEQRTVYGIHADKVKDWVEGTNLLDIGAGDGLISHLLIEKGIHCTAIDDNKIAVKLAKEKGVDVQLMSAYDMKFPKGSFDAILMADVIEHFEYPGEVIRKCYSFLQEGGYLYITTPPKKDGGGLHDKYHFREYSPTELREFISLFGFEPVGSIEIKNVRMYAKFMKK